MAYGSEFIPTEIRKKTAERMIVISWDNGDKFEYTMEYLRVACPCAGCCGHHPSEAKLIDGKQDVTVVSIEPIGHYAIKLKFSDDHDTGVYSWETLYELGKKQEEKWSGYLSDLDGAGKKRKSNIIPIKAI
ncbi:MAG: DUF971 domain-containing protein [Magnetococcales bacterium]|nr:DUF971 domain-containing protein [Magnetococcales bacterium]